MLDSGKGRVDQTFLGSSIGQLAELEFCAMPMLCSLVPSTCASLCRGWRLASVRAVLHRFRGGAAGTAATCMTQTRALLMRMAWSLEFRRWLAAAC